MGRNPDLDAYRKELKKQRILETAFPVLADGGIETVSMNEIASACGIGIATLYRYYGSKADLVLAVNAWIWDVFVKEYSQRLDVSGMNAAEEFDYYLESFLELYRNHRDILRFNQCFNLFVQNEHIGSEQIRGFMGMMEKVAGSFHGIYEKGKKDGSLKTNDPEEEVFSVTLHVMLSAVTRYAVGLVYQNSSEPEAELQLLKKMLHSYYCVQA